MSAPSEGSAATTINGDPSPTGDRNGAAYVFRRTSGAWAQLAYLKAWNSRPELYFGVGVAVSDTAIAVTTPWESTNAAGIFDPSLEGGVPAIQPDGLSIGAAYLY